MGNTLTVSDYPSFYPNSFYCYSFAVLRQARSKPLEVTSRSFKLVLSIGLLVVPAAEKGSVPQKTDAETVDPETFDLKSIPTFVVIHVRSSSARYLITIDRVHCVPSIISDFRLTTKSVNEADWNISARAQRFISQYCNRFSILGLPTTSRISYIKRQIDWSRPSSPVSSSRT